MRKILPLVLLLLFVLTPASFAFAKNAPQKVILVVSFGSSYEDTRIQNIDAIESEIAAAYPDWEVRRAFTAQIIIDILSERDGLVIDNVEQAMQRLVDDGVTEVVIQPNLVIPGFEYDDMMAEIAKYSNQFATLTVGKPLLYDADDYDTVIDALAGNIPEVLEEDTAVVFMGHGTHHFTNATYSMLQNMMHAKGYENMFVGCVEGFPFIDTITGLLTAYGAHNVELFPLMVVAGDHANNDMAGNEDDSWYTVLTKAGFTVNSHLQGLGENAAIRALILEHLAETMTKAGL